MQIEEDYFPVLVPNGLWAVPEYVARLFEMGKSPRPLVILTTEHAKGFGLARDAADTKIAFAMEGGAGGSALEHDIRLFFQKRGLVSLRGYWTECENHAVAIRRLTYPMPDFSDAVSALCVELLTECFAVAPDQALYFRDSAIARAGVGL